MDIGVSSRVSLKRGKNRSRLVCILLLTSRRCPSGASCRGHDAAEKKEEGELTKVVDEGTWGSHIDRNVVHLQECQHSVHQHQQHGTGLPHSPPSSSSRWSTSSCTRLGSRSGSATEVVRWNHPAPTRNLAPAPTPHPPSPHPPEEQLASWLSSPLPAWSTGGSTEACGVSRAGAWWPPCQSCATAGTRTSPSWRTRRHSLRPPTSTFNLKYLSSTSGRRRLHWRQATHSGWVNVKLGQMGDVCLHQIQTLGLVRT